MKIFKVVMIILSIMTIVYGFFGFIVVKRYAKRWEKSKHVMNNDEILQKEFRQESKKIGILCTVAVFLIVLLNVISLILIFLDA